MERARGIDVSHWHPVTDWTEIPPDFRFFAAKVSEGTANADPTFARHRDGARASGRFDLLIWYHLARPGDGAAQAHRFMSLVGQLGPNERLALDTERTSQVGVDFILAFFDALPRDRRHLLYTSAGVWAGMRNPPFPEARDVDLWLPRYGTASEPVVPDPWHDIGRGWTLWQNSESGIVPGVGGPCDTNVFNGGRDALLTYAALSPLVA